MGNSDSLHTNKSGRPKPTNNQRTTSEDSFSNTPNGSLLRINRSLRSSQTSNRNPERRTRNVTQTNLVEKLDRSRITTMLTARTQTNVRRLVIESVHSKINQPTNTRHVQRFERILFQNPVLKVPPQEHILGIVTRKPKSRLRKIVRPKTEQIQAMQRSARRLDVLIDDLLDLSKIDADRFVLTWPEFDIDDPLNELIGEFAPITQNKHQKIVLQQSETPTLLCADRTRVAQVVSNVLSNATKYSPENKNVFLGTRITSSGISLIIRDEGIGMTPEVQEKMFTPFFRAPDATTQTEVGTRLGLVITKSIIQLHGGEISIKSELGTGTTVTITLSNCQTVGHSHPDPTKNRPPVQISE